LATIEGSKILIKMTQPIIAEPTLNDVLDKINGIDSKVERLSKDVEGFNNRFSDYQQAVQWVVQLAFSLIASATVTVIITSIFHR
jgi:hypothetical protein